MELPNEFFTIQSMLTLSGATGATFIVGNGIQQAFDFNPKWLALVIALFIVELGVYLTNGTGIDYLVGVVNGFLVFSCAAGGTSMLGGGGANQNGGTPTGGAGSPSSPGFPGGGWPKRPGEKGGGGGRGGGGGGEECRDTLWVEW